MKYFDTHCHLNGDFFKLDIAQSIKEANMEGVSHIVLPGATVKDSKFAITLSKKYPQVFASVGIHPSDVLEEDLTYLKAINPDDIVAVGEVGIDLYRDDHPPVQKQISVFKAHIEFALKHHKPLMIHMRKGEEIVYDLVKNYPNLKFVMHSYTASLAWAKKFLALGAYFSFSGIVTFKNAKEVQEVAKIIPREKILAETDAPFLAPTPFRGKVNRPAYVKHTVDFLVSLRKEKDLADQIFANSLSFFNLTN